MIGLLQKHCVSSKIDRFGNKSSADALLALFCYKILKCGCELNESAGK